jgi:hypothetical protein
LSKYRVCRLNLLTMPASHHLEASFHGSSRRRKVVACVQRQPVGQWFGVPGEDPGGNATCFPLG